MKRVFEQMQHSKISNSRNDAIVEGIVVAVTSILDTATDRKGKYWTALICDSNQNVSRLSKYLSSKTSCRLYERMTESFKNKTGVKLNKLRVTGDYLYTASNETIAISKVLSFTPACTEHKSIREIESMSDGCYISSKCKIMDIGPVRIHGRKFI